VAASVLASAAVLLSASLSYLGLGVQSPTPSWGYMLGEAFDVFYQAPLYAVVPGVCVVLLSGAYVLIGHGLRVRQIRGPASSAIEHLSLVPSVGEPVLIGAPETAAPLQ
jgi:ABC-type dipeptide/oligopeptide/nickel transport system permease subunit